MQNNYFIYEYYYLWKIIEQQYMEIIVLAFTVIICYKTTRTYLYKDVKVLFRSMKKHKLSNENIHGLRFTKIPPEALKMMLRKDYYR